MTAASLIDALDQVADAARRADIPADPAARDAVVVSAMRAGAEILGLASRILEAQRAWDEQRGHRRPYPPPGQPQPKPQPQPNPKPKRS